eukprot:CAMPEP_0201524744 /NCGR_PEP_ID=MMETSP0161_2-20130828/24934_1 /ASSEMBLY_ACC=CAM_ASM_000251 /TAXON_ID=180227 /ORGANISM="Neoparamoeba aestuarina, Strain SoJaBio B1-5/56/2" /LENGTH=134 /DNA_ID=CAMNT_0047924303 /DNA_START=37 /DNA_END=438 /DNA_ORIENTATION=+
MGDEPIQRNTILKIIEEEHNSIDSKSSSRIPPYVMSELENSVKMENYFACYEHEKVMARCAQDKTWTIWKCQKLRDDYYRCLADENRLRRSDHLNNARWKYAMGVYGGEHDGRRKFVEQLWKEYYPDKEIPHAW